MYNICIYALKKKNTNTILSFFHIFVYKTVINMGKSILFLSVFLMSSLGVYAQGYYDDMYYTPSEKNSSTEVQTSSVGDENIKEGEKHAEYKESNIVAGRDVDEYNRRYSSDEIYDEREGDKLSESPKVSSKDDSYSDEGWINGFNGSQSDYEYSTRIIRMSSPSLAIHISSPYYWDVVYGSSSFDWNVYVDGNYAYAFPTFSNPLWWDWRFGRSYYGFYNRWYYSPYYPGFYAGGYPYYWDNWYYGHYHCHYPHYGHYPYYGWHGRPVYYSGSRVYRNDYRTGSTGRTGINSGRVGTTTSRRTGSTSSYGTDTRSSTVKNVWSRRSGSTSTRRSGTVSENWNTTDNNRSSIGTSTSRSSSTFNSRSSSSNSGIYNRSSNRSSSYSSPSRSGSYNSSRSSYTPSSRSGSRR